MPRVYLLAAPLIACTLAACETAPIQNDAASPVPRERIYAMGAPGDGLVPFRVKHDHRLFPSCDVHVYIDGTDVARIDGGEIVTLYLRPGEHLVGARNVGVCLTKSSEATVNIRPGVAQTFRIKHNSDGYMTLGPTAF